MCINIYIYVCVCVCVCVEATTKYILQIIRQIEIEEEVAKFNFSLIIQMNR